MTPVDSYRDPDLYSFSLQTDLESPLFTFRLTQKVTVHTNPRASVPEPTVDQRRQNVRDSPQQASPICHQPTWR